MMTKIKSALVSAVIAAILAMAMYVLGVGDVFALNTKMLVNTGVMAILTGVVSLLKSWGTTEEGTFAGVKVK